MPVNKDVFILEADNAEWVPAYHGLVRYVRRESQGGKNVGDAGIWRADPDKPVFGYRGSITYELAETVFVMKGRVTIEDDSGNKFSLKAGDSMSFDKGSTAYWTQETADYEEFFVYS